MKKHKMHVNVVSKVDVMIIPANYHVEAGHQHRPCGVGIHSDKRKRRRRTRSAELRAVLKDRA